MKKAIICLFMILAVCLSGCSFANSGGNSNSQPEPETVIVKETVIVTETVYVTDPNNAEETEQTTTEGNTSEDDNNKGYTTQDVLKKAAEASDNQYWIVYFGDDGLLMSTFNALEDYTVKLTADGKLVCDKMVGSSIVKEWNSDKCTFTSGMHAKLTIVANDVNDIVGSNFDVYDEKNNNTISAKTN